MELLLITATTAEIRPLMEKMTFLETENQNVSRYRYRNLNIDVLITGVGMVPMAYQLGRLLQTKKYELAINAGICGAFPKEIPIGEVCNIVEDFFSECGAEDHETFLTLFEMGLDDPAEMPYQEGKLVNQSFPTTPTIASLPRRKGLTVNTIHGNRESIDKIRQQWNPDTESMEGAAFFYACFMANIPCLQIRSISNRVEERDKSRWNIDLAFKNLSKTLLNILKEL